MWGFYLYNSIKTSYDTILVIYLINDLGIDIRMSEHTR